MKTKNIFITMLISFALFSIVFFACDTGSTITEDEDEFASDYRIEFTGINESFLKEGFKGQLVIVFPAGTLIDDVIDIYTLAAFSIYSYAPETAIAFSDLFLYGTYKRDNKTGTLTAIAPLAIWNNNYPYDKWTGSGTYDIWFINTPDNDWDCDYSGISTGSRWYFYRKTNVSIESQKTTIPISLLDFVKDIIIVD